MYEGKESTFLENKDERIDLGRTIQAVKISIATKIAWIYDKRSAGRNKAKIDIG